MSYPYTQLEIAGVDIAGLVNENFLNNFSSSHHKVNPDLYQGAEYSDELGDKIEIKYVVSNPLKFDLTPIPEGKFRPIYESHLMRKGMNKRYNSRIHTVPSNIKLIGQNILFEIAVIDSVTGDDIVRVPFNWDLEARCAVNLIEIDDSYSVKLDPLKVEFSVNRNSILLDLKQKLLPSEQDRIDTPNKYKADDPEWCIKLERLILILVNKVIAVQLSNFIRSWELPKALELSDGVDFKPNYLNVTDNYMAIGGQVSMSPIETSKLQTQISSLLSEYTIRVQEELDSLSDEEIINIQSRGLKSAEWLRNTTESLMIPIEESSSGKGSNSSKNYEKNVSLLVSSKPFDYIAKKELTFKDGSGTSHKLDRLLKAEAKWWLNVHTVSGGVNNHSIWVKATPEIGGYARVCFFDVDPKNFGNWKCVGPDVEISIKNAKFELFPSFEDSGVYVRGRFSSDGIVVRFGNWPSWANDILGWITSALSDPIIDALGALLSLFRIRIIKYPHHFPGTGLEWTPNLNTVPSNIGPYLEFSADPKFE